jgi:hypothetical protein
MAKNYSGCNPIFVKKSVNRIYISNLTKNTQKIFLETLFSQLDFINAPLGLSLLCTFNNRSLKCNTLHALRGTFLHVSEYKQKLTKVEFNKPCKLYISISDLSVPSLFKLCIQSIRFSSTQQNHGTLCEEFEKFLPTQLAQSISVEYKHLRPNKLEVLVPEPTWTCLCVHRYSCCQKTREQPRCCIENYCNLTRGGTDISEKLNGLQL